MNTEKDIRVGSVDFTFRNYGMLKKQFAGPALEEEWRSKVGTAKPSEYIENDTCLHALMLSEIMFDNTVNSIRIFSGSNIAKFLYPIETSFLNACKKIATNKGKIRIITIVSNEQDASSAKSSLKEFADKIRMNFKEGIDFLCACDYSRFSLPHYIACDSKMLRLEEPHSILSAMRMHK